MVDRATGQKFGVLPPPATAWAGPALAGRGRLTPTCDFLVDSHCSSHLTNPGRGAVQHGEKEYLFFWDPSGAFPAGYAYDLRRWVDDLAAGDYGSGHTAGSPVGNPVSVVQQYYDFSGPGRSKNFIPNAITDGGLITDRDPFPAKHCTDSFASSHGTYTFPSCLTAGQIQSEVRHWVSAHHLPTGLNVEYFVFTPPGVGTCNDSSNLTCEVTSYCGEHSLIPTGHSQILYALIPWLPGTLCDTGTLGITPVYSSAVDNSVGVFSHELSETMTDPDLDAWQGRGGSSDEIGDKCAYFYDVGRPYLDFTGLPRAPHGAVYNARLGPDRYLIQMEYDNRFGGCSQWNTDPAPGARISRPSSPRAGRAATFSLHSVVDRVGIAYVRWSFGDGRAARSLGRAPIRHTYRRAGTYKLRAVITDNHGNELRKTASLRVRKN